MARSQITGGNGNVGAAKSNLTNMMVYQTVVYGEFPTSCVGLRYLYLEDYLTIDAQTDPADGGGSTHDRALKAKQHVLRRPNRLKALHPGSRELATPRSTRQGVAVGDTNEVLDISGSATLPTYAAAAGGRQLPGGFYTASSNIGNSSTNHVGLVAEYGLNVAYKLTDNIQLTAGYTFLYWDHVYRSGNQIDHNINPALNPAFSTISPTGGPASPQRLNAESEFWAQGVNLGVRFSF